MQIISTVCQVNRTVYDAMQTAGKAKDIHVLKWPYVDIGEDNVDPLRDVRVLKLLRRVNMEHYCITVGWSFGMGCRLLFWTMATNTLGQFLIAKTCGKTVHVYDKNGTFQFSFNSPTDNAKTEIEIADLVTEDVSEKIYLQVKLKRPEAKVWEGEVQVFNKTADLEYKFPVRYARMERLIVSGRNLLILGSSEADVYNQNGEFVRSFEFSKSGGDKYLDDCHCVHVFTMEGQEIAKFKSGVGLDLASMRFSPRSAGEHVVIAGHNRHDRLITVEIYTVDGKLVRRILLRDERGLYFRGITVTMEGHIAVGFAGRRGDLDKIVVY